MNNLLHFFSSSFYLGKEPRLKYAQPKTETVPTSKTNQRELAVHRHVQWDTITTQTAS